MKRQSVLRTAVHLRKFRLRSFSYAYSHPRVHRSVQTAGPVGPSPPVSTAPVVVFVTTVCSHLSGVAGPSTRNVEG